MAGPDFGPRSPYDYGTKLGVVAELGAVFVNASTVTVAAVSSAR